MPMFNGRFVQRLVVLTGAGVSAESGVPTFRDPDGLWEQYDPMDLATPEAFRRDPALIYRFYNSRRAQLAGVEPNAAHLALARLQREFAGDVFLVTQNVDDLHERGGSLRPDVVWFGEMPYFMDEIETRLADCDLFIAVGTSGLVYPAAGFVRTARTSGATAVEVNLEPSDTASLFHLQRRGPATEQLPALVAELLS